MSCPYFPQCGGCDFINLNEEEYRAEKQKIFKNIITKSDINLETNPHWHWVNSNSRRKVIFQISKQNEIGFFGKKSNSLVKIDDCVIAERAISSLISPLNNLLKKLEHGSITKISATLFDNGLDLIFFTKKTLNFSQNQKLIKFAQDNSLNISIEQKGEITPIFVARKNQLYFDNEKITLTSNIFIQATKKGLYTIISVIKNAISAQNYKNKPKIADLYAGFGAYSFAISDLAKSVHSFEGDEGMAQLISQNSNELGKRIISNCRDLFSNPIKTKELENFDVIIINPPRNGAETQATEIAKIAKKNNEKIVIYVSCNPETFFRDAKIMLKNGFRIKELHVLDQFYGSKHLELISVIING